jgi:1-acyl-sn-glycerol-3-phosphate acyltransferase
MDIPVLLAALPFPIRFAAKKSLFRVPFLGWHLRRAGHVAIDRENAHAAMRALDLTAERMRDGAGLVFFPEGRISQDGRLADFRRGAFLLARRSGASLVPVTILGTRAVLGPSSWTLRPGPVEVTVGDPIVPGSADLSDLASRVRVRVQAQGTVPLA